MLGFETLTFCPIERTLIEPALLTAEERKWVDDYHARVLAVLTPEMTDAEDRAWLTAKCASLS
jgi:Xaa-Pro aminopeptidase